MAFMCDNCGKGVVHGRQSMHKRGVAGKRWKKRAQSTLRLFMPNLQKIAVMVDGKKTQRRICTDCIRKFKKTGRLAPKKSSSAVASI